MTDIKTEEIIKVPKVPKVEPEGRPVEVETIKLMLDNYETLKATCDAMTSDFEKFNGKKIKACGQRVRSNLLTIKKLCDTLRKQIITDIKEIPIKHRIDTDEETPEVSAEVETVPEVVEEPPKKVRKPRRANKKKEEKKED
jgi:hypothetical protein